MKHYRQFRLYGDANHAENRREEINKRQGHPLFSRYRAMITRCYNPKAANYAQYGSRGIRVCDRWLSDFWAFVEDVVNPEDPKLQLHRIDANGNYEPGNVEWVSAARNSRARRSSVLTQTTADAIREERRKGTSILRLSQKYQVGVTTVHSVLTGRTWNDGQADDMRIRRLDRSSLDRQVSAALLRNVRDHPLYQTYMGIKARLTNSRNANYSNYGGRGIKMHAPWLKSARRFLEDIEHEIGRRPSKAHSLDRKRNDGHYEPGNIRWATASQQVRNRRKKIPLRRNP